MYYCYVLCTKFFVAFPQVVAKQFGPYIEDITTSCCPVMPKNDMSILFIYTCVALGINFEVEGGEELCCSTEQ